MTAAQLPPLRRVFCPFRLRRFHIMSRTFLRPTASIDARAQPHRTSSFVSKIFATTIERLYETRWRAFDHTGRGIVLGQRDGVLEKHDAAVQLRDATGFAAATRVRPMQSRAGRRPLVGRSQ
jgi:hypothetical protein